MCQRTDALNVANERRYHFRDLKADLDTGAISLAEALVDERAQRFPIHRLLNAQHQWGAARTKKTLSSLAIWPLNAVGALTERQRDRIVEMAAAIGAEPKRWLVTPKPEPVDEKLKLVIKEVDRLGWKTRKPLDVRVAGLIVISPLGEAMVTDVEDLNFLSAEVAAA